MNQLHLSENITRLRRERKITQEELADFLGVTKAAVSKWENGQTSPDILLLPQLACFFDITIDQLLGYEAQLSGEQIRRCYLELCQDFVSLPFQEAYEKTRSLAHRYYSCYPLLLQLCTLYLNHFMLAQTAEERRQMLHDALRLCDRILEGCRDVGICADASSMKAMLYLQLGAAAEAVELLEPAADLSHLSLLGSMGAVLIQAYLMSGEQEKAKDYAQVRQYADLLNLVGDLIQLLPLYAQDPKRCGEIMRRAAGIMELYHLEQLHPNLAAQYYFQAALIYAGNPGAGSQNTAKRDSASQDAEKRDVSNPDSQKRNIGSQDVQKRNIGSRDAQNALHMLRGFERCVSSLLSQERITLHGDSYFDRLDVWIDRLPLGDMAPRDKAFARQNALDALKHPAFSSLKETEGFQDIYKRLNS